MEKIEDSFLVRKLYKKPTNCLTQAMQTTSKLWINNDFLSQVITKLLFIDYRVHSCPRLLKYNTKEMISDQQHKDKKVYGTRHDQWYPTTHPVIRRATTSEQFNLRPIRD